VASAINARMSFSPTPWPHAFGFTPIDTFGVLARRNAGRQIAIAKGVRFGPKPKLTDHQQGEALKRLAAGASCRAIAKTMGVHHATIARLTG
jgi:Helix-turn-helix domain